MHRQRIVLCVAQGLVAEQPNPRRAPKPSMLLGRGDGATVDAKEKRLLMTPVDRPGVGGMTFGRSKSTTMGRVTRLSKLIARLYSSDHLPLVASNIGNIAFRQCLLVKRVAGFVHEIQQLLCELVTTFRMAFKGGCHGSD